MNFIIIFLLLCLNYICMVNGDISDKRLCGDPNCSEPVSVALTLIGYPSNEPNILSFPINVKLNIYSKSAGSRTDLWGAEYNGKRGYVPHKLIREIKVFKNKLDYLVATEGHENEDQNNISTSHKEIETLPDSFVTSAPSIGALADVPSPTKASESYEVIDGTTIAILPDSNKEIITEPTLTKPDLDIAVQQKQNEPDVLKTDLVDSQSSEVVEANISETNSEAKQNIRSDGNDVNLKKDQVPLHEHISSYGQESDSSVKYINENFNKDSEEEDEADGDDDYVDDEEEEEDGFVDSEELDGINNSENSDLKIDENVSSNIDSNITLNADQNTDSVSKENVIDLNVNADKLFLKNDETIVTIETKSISETDVNSNIHDDNKNKQDAFTIDEVKEFDKNGNINNLQNKQDDIQNVPGFDLIVENNKNNIVNSVDENELVNPTTESSITTQSFIVTESNFIEKSHLDLPTNIEKNANLKSSVLTESLEVDYSQQMDNTHGSTTESVEVKNNNFPENEISSVRKEPAIELSQEIFQNQLEINTTIIEDNTLNILETAKQNFDIHTEESTTPNTESKLDSVNHEANNFDNLKLFETNNKEQTESSTTVINHVEDDMSEMKFEVEQMTGVDELKSEIEQRSDVDEFKSEIEVPDSPGFFENFYNFFQSSVEDSTIDKSSVNEILENSEKKLFVENNKESHLENVLEDSDNCQMCTVSSSQCPEHNEDHQCFGSQSVMDFPAPSYDTFVYLAVTGITVLLFTLGYYYIEKMRQDGTLIGKINELEKALLISSKECIILKEGLQKTNEKLVHVRDTSFGSNETVQALKIELEDANNVRSELEEQISNLEKELETATEAGLELNRMLSDFLTSQNGSDTLIQSVERLQTQLNEQQHVIGDMNTTIGSKNIENEVLQSEISIANEKIVDLQLEVDKLVKNLVSLQEEKVNNERDFEARLKDVELKLDTVKQVKLKEITELTSELQKVQTSLNNTERLLGIKEKELSILHDSMKSIQGGNCDVQNIFEVSHLKAEFDESLKDRNTLLEKLQNLETAYKLQEESSKETADLMMKLKTSLDDAEKEKIEAQMRLEVLSSYFKEREVQLQKDVARHEELWLHNQGETNSNVERMKVLQEEFQNYKSQNEMLKKEIVDQEVSLKSQISVLEKKVHENWLVARQAERRLEESKQECAQLRNRLTLVEKNLANSNQITDEAKSQYRVLSPLNTNGDLHGSPLHIPGVETSASPPLLFPPREHMTTSPPIPFMGLPPPPPPGVPFMPPPPGVPFMPPPPSLYPGDRRPPPLGRMSSPPPSTFSPNRTFSPYDRDNSPSHFSTARPYGSHDPSFRDMDNYRHMSPPPPVSQYEIHPDASNDWDEPHRTGHRPKSGRQKKGALKNDI